MTTKHPSVTVNLEQIKKIAEIEALCGLDLDFFKNGDVEGRAAVHGLTTCKMFFTIYKDGSVEYSDY